MIAMDMRNSRLKDNLLSFNEKPNPFLDIKPDKIVAINQKKLLNDNFFQIFSSAGFSRIFFRTLSLFLFLYLRLPFYLLLFHKLGY